MDRNSLILHVESPGWPEAGETGADNLLTPRVLGLHKGPESPWGAWCAAAEPLHDGSAFLRIYFTIQECHGW